MMGCQIDHAEIQAMIDRSIKQERERLASDLSKLQLGGVTCGDSTIKFYFRNFLDLVIDTLRYGC